MSEYHPHQNIARLIHLRLWLTPRAIDSRLAPHILQRLKLREDFQVGTLFERGGKNGEDVFLAAD